MGLSTCIIKFEDGTLMYGSFQNTSGYMLRKLYRSREERWAKRRLDSDDAYNGEDCECSGETVEVYLSDGYELYWTGKACKEHLRYKEPSTLYDDDNLLRADTGKPNWIRI